MHRYEEIESYVTDLIRNGTLKEGDQIPRETELAQLFNTSRPTVRQALSKLTLNGTIVRIKGKGSFVQHTKLAQEYTRFISSYRAELLKKGLSPRTIVVSLEEIPGTPDMPAPSMLIIETPRMTEKALTG